MKELLDYRRRLLERIDAAAEEFRAACLAVADDKSPLEPGGWNTHQVAAHVRDVEQHAYGLRVRRTMEEDNPEFQNFDTEAWIAEHYDPEEPLEEILDAFVTSVHKMAAWLRGLPNEAWSRESRHTVYGGGFTLQTWVERGLAHVEEHLETVRGMSNEQ
ncbi:MAG: hypothetical protein GXP40_00790 [Chloroflexi bacterium]|nr:hypothetical protein [Chloroflexota bacterium]